VADDFVLRLVAVLSSTPQTSWETRIRIEFGGSEHYVARRQPQQREQVQQLTQLGISPRKARRFVRGY